MDVFTDLDTLETLQFRGFHGHPTTQARLIINQPSPTSLPWGWGWGWKFQAPNQSGSFWWPVPILKLSRGPSHQSLSSIQDTRHSGDPKGLSHPVAGTRVKDLTLEQKMVLVSLSLRNDTDCRSFGSGSKQRPNIYVLFCHTCKNNTARKDQTLH